MKISFSILGRPIISLQLGSSPAPAPPPPTSDTSLLFEKIGQLESKVDEQRRWEEWKSTASPRSGAFGFTRNRAGEISPSHRRWEP